MTINEILLPNTKVKLTQRGKFRYIPQGDYTVQSVDSRMLVLKKDTGYIETINIIDLKQKRYRLFLENGNEVVFEPMADAMKAEREQIQHSAEEYKQSVKSISGQQVKELWEQGKTVEEIAAELQAKENTVRAITTKLGFTKKREVKEVRQLKISTEEILEVCRVYGTGKVAYKALSEKFDITPDVAQGYIFRRDVRRLLREEKEAKQTEAAAIVKQAVAEEVAEENKMAAVGVEEVNTCEKCVYGIGTDNEYTCHEGNNFLPVGKETPACVKFISVDEQLDVAKEMLFKPFAEQFVGNLIEQPLPIETEEYPDITIPTQTIRNSVAAAAVTAASRIKQDVDEMMEMVGEKTEDIINNPPHYLTGGIETIDYIKAKLTPEGFEGFCIGSIIQYVSRYRLKGGLQDLKKAEQVLQRIISVKESA